MSYLEHGGSKMREAGRQLLHLQFGCGGEGSRRSGATHLCICCNYGTVRNCNCASHLKTRPRCSFFSLPPCRYWSSLPAWPYVAPMWGWRGVEGGFLLLSLYKYPKCGEYYHKLSIAVCCSLHLTSLQHKFPSIDFNNRPVIILLSSPEKIVATSKSNRRRHHNTIKIHKPKAGMSHRRPKTEEQYHNRESNTKNINDRTKRFEHSEWTPGEIIGLRNIGEPFVVFAVGVNSSGDSTVEEKAVPDEIGGVDTAYGYCTNNVESEFRAEDYEGEEAGDDTGCDDSEYRSRSPFAYLQSITIALPN